MNNFSLFIDESRKSNGSEVITAAELDQYISKVGKKLPSTVQRVIYLTKKYALLDSDSLDEIKSTLKPNAGAVMSKYDIPETDFETLWSELKDLGRNITLLPQYQSEAERKAFEAGKVTVDDLTIDLTTPKGRNDAAKMYMPMIYKIVNQYVGKSRLGRDELMSAACAGFADAITDFGVDKGGDEKEHKVTFKTYASYRVQQAILNDINQFGHSLSGTNWYASKKFGAGLLDAVSIDGMSTNDDGEIKNDHIAALGEDPEPLERDEEKQWKELYDLIESTFKTRDVNIFYRYFGLHGYKREKSKDIAKDFGMSEGNIRNSIINKMIAFLKRDRGASEILSNIQDMYNESLMCSLINSSKEVILETLVNDDMFILLEELNRWNNKDVFFHSLYLAYENISTSDINVINALINGDFSILDDLYKKNKKSIVRFLKEMYPTENIARKTDVTLLEYMEDIQNAYQKYKTK